MMFPGDNGIVLDINRTKFKRKRNKYAVFVRNVYHYRYSSKIFRECMYWRVLANIIVNSIYLIFEYDRGTL